MVVFFFVRCDPMSIFLSMLLGWVSFRIWVQLYLNIRPTPFGIIPFHLREDHNIIIFRISLDFLDLLLYRKCAVSHVK